MLLFSPVKRLKVFSGYNPHNTAVEMANIAIVLGPTP